MSNNMTVEEYDALRKGDKSQEEITEEQKARIAQERVDALSTRNFLIGTTDETIPVLFSDASGSIKEILIRAILPKRVSKKFDPLITKFRLVAKDPINNSLDDEETDNQIAEFLEAVTVDSELDKAFWLEGNYPENVPIDIVMVYMAEPGRRRGKIGKFRG